VCRHEDREVLRGALSAALGMSSTSLLRFQWQALWVKPPWQAVEAASLRRVPRNTILFTSSWRVLQDAQQDSAPAAVVVHGTKKTDAAEHPEVFGRVGLLYDEPPDRRVALRPVFRGLKTSRILSDRLW
jgi:hypothetical protein